jgi:hypothetical protein
VAQDIFLPMRSGIVDVIAGNDVALHWVQSPPASLTSFAELRLVAQARCAHLYGGAPGDWRIGADWQASRPFVCVALPQDVVLPIEECLAEFKLVPRWHSAWSVLSCILPHAFASQGWNAVRSPARVVIWHCSNGQVDCMATCAVAQQDSIEAARRASQQMRVEMSRSDQFGNAILHWLDLVADNAEPAAELPGVVPVHRDSRLAAMIPRQPSEAATALALRMLARSASA